MMQCIFDYKINSDNCSGSPDIAAAVTHAAGVFSVAQAFGGLRGHKGCTDCRSIGHDGMVIGGF